MHQRTREVLNYLDTTRTALQRAVDDVPATARSTRPAPASWSVAEVIEHVSLVEARVVGLLLEHLARARADGLPAETHTSAVVDDAIVRDLVDRSQERTAGDTSQPRGASLDASWGVLNERRTALRDVITDADGLALGAIRIPHPRLGDIDLYQWLSFLGAHETRHVAQIEEARAALRA